MKEITLERVLDVVVELKENVDKIQQNMNGMQENMNSMQENMNSMQQTINSMQQNMNSMQQTIDNMQNDMKETKQEMKQGFREVNDRLNVIERVQKQMLREQNGAKDIIIEIARKVGEHERRITNLENGTCVV